MAMQESSWTQFCVPVRPPDQAGGNSRTLITNDCGYGAFQITYLMHEGNSAPWDRPRVASEPFYNAATGAFFLADNWRRSQCVGDRQPQVVEDWYTATWMYGPNQATADNNPSNPNLPSTRTVYTPGVSSPTDGWTYQEKIWGHMEHPPSGAHWAALFPAYPNRGDIPWTSGNNPPAIPEPHCAGPTNCTQTRQVHTSSCLSGATPTQPSSLEQRSFTGSTISVGGTTTAGTLTLRGIVSNPRGGQARLAVEVKPVGDSFNNLGVLESAPVNSGSVAKICVSGLSNGQYHWRAWTRDDAGVLSAPVSFGGNAETSPDFIVQANVCAVCNFSDSIIVVNSLAEGVSCGAPLSATLSATPTNGSAPLNDVDLTASVSGTATGTINYTFYCNRADAGTDITPGWVAKYDGITSNPKTALNVCDYGAPGTYTPKVIVERGSSAAEARTTITVTQIASQGPAITTTGASSVTQGSASLNMSVNPNGNDTSVWFEWGSGSSFCCSTGQQVITASAGTSLLSMTVGGLQCDTTYSFRARAQSVGGSATGSTLSFRTGTCGNNPQTVQLVADPSFEGGNNAWWVANPSFYINRGTNFPNPHTGSYYAALATAQGDPGNNLQGGVISPQVTIPSNAASAELRFWYRISTNETTTTTAFDTFSFSLVKPGNQQTIVASYSNLNTTGTTYKERVISVPTSFFGIPIQLFFGAFTNGSLPTVFRIDDVTLSAVVPQPGSSPSVSTEIPDQIQATGARLNMSVNANGASTSVWFNIEAGDSTPDDETEHISIGNGVQSSNVSISAFGLQCGTLYYFRARATNSFGSNNGLVKSFTTSACGGGSPRADTDSALNVTQTSATLTADVDPNGLQAQAWFDWGASPSLGQETVHVSVGSGAGFVNFSQTLSGLTCGTEYYFANHVSNSIGQDTGSTLSFTTLPCDGGGSPSGFFLDFRRQGCSGAEPAVLLWWTVPAGMGNVFTVRRGDGGYAATVDSSQGGMVHLVSSSLLPGETYGFYVEGTLNGSTVRTNTITVPVISDECRLQVGPSDLPHLPLLWTGLPFCSGGTASVPVLWTAVGGAASYTLTRIDNVAAQLTPYPNLTGTSFVDSSLAPGAEYEYMLDAVGSGGSRRTNVISVFVPSGVCAEPSTPGPFPAQVSTPVCDAGKGAVTLSWTRPSGAAPTIRTYWADDGFTNGSGSTPTLSSHYIDGIRPGALVKFMVQAEAAATPLKYRSVIMSQRIPLEICGASVLPPAVTTVAATYIQERQALLRASIIPNAAAANTFFEWGTTTSYGSMTPLRSAGEGYRSASLGEALTGLACATTYHYRAIASNVNGTTPGADVTFSTASCSTTLPTVTVTAIDPTATEQPMTSGEFLIQRTGSTSSALSVMYSVTGTATVGMDHTLASGSITIPAGSSSFTLTVFPTDDQLVEPDETVVVTLQPQSQYLLGSPSNATVTIVSDDSGCVVSAVSPAGGETWVKGTAHVVAWNTTSGCVSFALLLQRGGVFDGAIAANLTGNQYAWTPPAWLVPGSGLQIEVVGFGTDGTGVSAISNSFSLVNPAALPPIIFEDTVETDAPLNYQSQGWGVTNFTSHSPSNSRADSPAFYGNNVNSSLITPKIDVSGRSSVSLSFWHRFDLADFDSLNVWAKTEQGDWILLRSFTGTQIAWQQVTLDLSGFIGQSSIQIAFQLVSDAALTADGWYLDDIVVSGTSGSSIFRDGFESGDMAHWLTTPPPGTLLFFDDFEQQDFSAYQFIPFGSNPSTASWSFTQDGNGVFEAIGGTGSGGGDSLTRIAAMNQQDCLVSARLKITEVRNAGHHSGVVARLDTSLNFYELFVNTFSGSLILSRRSGTQEVRLASVSVSGIALNNWLTLKLQAVGNRLRGYLNGQVLIDVTDDAFATGSVGVMNAGSVTRFDDLRVEH
jgi:hypothetical protein